MKRKLIYKLELKVVFNILLAFLLSALTMAVMYIMWKFFLEIGAIYSQQVLDRIYRARLHYDFIKIAIELWIIIFISYSHLLLYKKIKYFVEVDEHIKAIAEGRIDKKIPEQSKAELGKIAKNMNEIIEKLNKSIEEERRSEQTKYELITNVSHDLRTPLTSILGYLELIDKDKYKDEVELRYYVNIAYEKSKRLNNLINDLFQYTIMRNSTLKLNKELINVIELINQMVLEFRLEFRKVDIECRTYFSEDKLLIVADAVKMARAFENLISNGMNYGSGTEYIDICTRKENNSAVIEIINYGEPIPSIDVPFIFERFYRVEKSRSGFTGGSGLGLAITKSIIELHEGEIFVESNYERTAFIIKLPLDS
ncbi:GHKL domain-containing protein [Clostridium sp. CM028]|uniref:sensor histidine kinase n=1 Tax=unclassified Clostridium TaxID=2614128 RepID=UPI001C0B432A|nr:MULTISPECIES: ATP-binding protein [unclassified Clostridium]MBU3091006.1 GHKL domain-containing protein [Clostridium sp. CF011]MBW9144994.1 GHKL domain-containing protein [Clostridium sp. CM027]MBW9148596.1 GHKL domain-containing protein [Clostridium sp. CM028]UVE40129.1 GHKL domain-containing protein [Clostridium sp. CM027]WLC60809.1 GHKL domain-containing protein [Clostridium sp. CM028]